MNVLSSISIAPRRTALPKAETMKAVAADTVEVGHTDQDFVPTNLKAVLQAAGKPYYDAPADAAAKAEYYKDLDPSSPSLLEDLNALMRRTHRETLSFKPRKYLHPWVDLRPNLRRASIYSAEPVSTDAPVHVTKRRDFTQKHRVKVKGR